MIEIKNISKAFGKIQALDGVSFDIPEASIFGLVGTNGAGKSTLLRILAGIYRQNSGSALIDGENPFENMSVKRKVFYISDDQYYFPNASMEEMKNFYASVYESFSEDAFFKLAKAFGLDTKRSINTFSKGMVRQSFIIFALASNVKYLLLDESFDGLDPVMRLAVKRQLADCCAEHGTTPIIASHNLRELEDICDRVGLLHKGGMVMDIDVQSIGTSLHKYQCAFAEQPQKDWFDALSVISFVPRSKLCTLISSAPEAEILAQINAHSPLFCERIPLTLEELFIAKMEGVGYEIDEIVL